MKILYLFSLICLPILTYSQNEVFEKYKDAAARIMTAAYADTAAWERLAYMCDTFGPRLSGSDNLEKSIEWIYNEMKKDGLENVRKEPVLITNWSRGTEYCQLIEPRTDNIPMLGLGGSIGTGPEGITAQVLVVKDTNELWQKAGEAKGSIVLFNAPWEGYGKTVQFRMNGASWAARVGAVASLIRSVSPIGMRNPHTGMMRYDENYLQIPHAAITHEDAMLLQRLYDRGQNPVVKLYMEAQTNEDAPSYNVMGELTGREKPGEIVAIGGHIDSWDAGTGAHDDGGGCIATWEALKLLKETGLVPRRTVRAVMWVNEENGLKGGYAYAEKHKDEPHHLLFEFDSGVYPPYGIRFSGSPEQFSYVESMNPLFEMIVPGLKAVEGGGGVDIRPMAEVTGTPQMSLGTEDNGEYFHHHHSPTDTIDKVNPKVLIDCIAAIALAIYIYADMP